MLPKFTSCNITRSVFGIGIFSCSPKETVGFRFTFAVIGVFLHSNSETTFFSNSWSVGHFRDNVRGSFSRSVLFCFSEVVSGEFDGEMGKILSARYYVSLSTYLHT